MKYTKTDLEFAASTLAKLEKGDVIYADVRKVSASGMTRYIRFYSFKDGTPIYLSWAIAVFLGLPMKDDSVIVRGCGMDMGFHTVYNLSHTMFGDGYALKHRGF